MLSRRVIAYYGLIRDSESLPATYGFAAGSAAPKEIGLRWESRGSPIYSAGLCSRAASHTPVAPKSANDCCFLFGFSLHLLVTGSATTLVVSRLQSSLRAYFALMLRPASWLALLSRTFTFELSLAGSPRTNVEYDYVGKQSIPTTGLSPASPTALWAAVLGLTPWIEIRSDTLDAIIIVHIGDGGAVGLRHRRDPVVGIVCPLGCVAIGIGQAGFAPAESNVIVVVPETALMIVVARFRAS